VSHLPELGDRMTLAEFRLAIATQLDRELSRTLMQSLAEFAAMAQRTGMLPPN
jgi:hypothetical protein